MPVAVEQFVKALEEAGIIAPDKLRAAHDKLSPGRKEDAQVLAGELVRQKVLTNYQVQEACQGRAKDLVLGNYTILDKIGQGGMGQVFKAQHRRMDRIVAIKLLPASVTKDQAAIARFEREVKAAAKLEHPNIVTAYDADEAAGRHFLVMQFVEGHDLSALVKKDGPLPVEQAVSCIAQAARGLEYAHRRGVVHRDIKPANLLLDLEGTVKILDMGLARLEPAAGEEHAELTGTDQIMGTVDFMSPEQALDTKHADERSDIYSLGITLWYLLTGRAVYGGKSVMAKLLAHREQPIPSLQAACPGATSALEAVFTKMVAKMAEDRFQSMSEVVVELERIRPDQGEELRLSEFLRGTKGSKAASGRLSIEPAVASKPPSSPVLEETITMAGPQIATDPTTEQLLVVPDEVPHLRASVKRPRLLVACAAGIALLLAGIILYLEGRKGTVRIGINDPAIEVVVDGNGATIKGINGEEAIKLQPGKHGLRIKYGELNFETDKFILNREDTIKLKVELLAGKVQVVQGDTVLGERPLAAIAPFDAQQANVYREAWAEHLGVEVEVSNDLGMKMRLIPPGEFTMGSTQEEVDALLAMSTDPWWKTHIASEAPQHRVKLTKPFYLGVYEVTQQEYEEVIGANPSHFSAAGPGKESVQGLEPGQHPVEMVSWFDAVDFCNKLSEKEGLKPYYFHEAELVNVLGGVGYRLPTEAEWEYACRAGSTTRWYFGDDVTKLEQHCWFTPNSGNCTHPVGKLAANLFGLYDMCGNVWEWCWDQHGAYGPAEAGDSTGPSAPGGLRVVRGGSFNNNPPNTRCAYRSESLPTYRDSKTYGFRVARTCN
jgi:eukaryotic-like serine/threonine-protein kinase